MPLAKLLSSSCKDVLSLKDLTYTEPVATCRMDHPSPWAGPEDIDDYSSFHWLALWRANYTPFVPVDQSHYDKVSQTTELSSLFSLFWKNLEANYFNFF